MKLLELTVLKLPKKKDVNEQSQPVQVLTIHVGDVFPFRVLWIS